MIEIPRPFANNLQISHIIQVSKFTVESGNSSHQQRRPENGLSILASTLTQLNIYTCTENTRQIMTQLERSREEKRQRYDCFFDFNLCTDFGGLTFFFRCSYIRCISRYMPAKTPTFHIQRQRKQYC